MSASLSPRHEATILPSLPPSPSLLEEVFSYPRPWSVRLEKLDPQSSRRSSLGSTGSPSKGKGKQIPEDEDEDEEVDAHRTSTHEVYPPRTDQAAETRQVEETLRRWELAERQRRKSIRESMHQTSAHSLFSSVTRTASLVLSRRSGSVSTSVPGSIRVREGYAVPLDDIDPSNVAVHSPSPSMLEQRTSLEARSSGTSENPFVHPSEHTPTRMLTPVASTPPVPSTPPSPSPFSDTRGGAELLTERTRSSGGKEPFVSRALGLRASPRLTPLQPTSQPALVPLRREGPEERQEVRWWHDWLCGCSEGPDRGGDNQAGRTNPFE